MYKIHYFVPLEKTKYSASSKNEPNNQYHGPLQYQISTKIQEHNPRLHHHHS